MNQLDSYSLPYFTVMPKLSFLLPLPVVFISFYLPCILYLSFLYIKESKVSIFLFLDPLRSQNCSGTRLHPVLCHKVYTPSLLLFAGSSCTYEQFSTCFSFRPWLHSLVWRKKIRSPPAGTDSYSLQTLTYEITRAQTLPFPPSHMAREDGALHPLIRILPPVIPVDLMCVLIVYRMDLPFNYRDSPVN